MSAILPPAFLFRYEFPVRFVEKPADVGSLRSELTDAHRLPSPRELNGEADFAQLKLGWNPGGLAFSLDVTGKTSPPVCDPANPAEADGLHVWIDTRNTQSIHRAGRFCHRFCFLPAGKGRGTPPIPQLPRGGKRGFAVQFPIARAREDAPLVDSTVLEVSAETRKGGYSLQAWLPADAMHGFDPEDFPRVGFFYAVRDAELGVQTLTVGEEFPYAHDPSLWATLELES